jgi:hypothetical protein
VIHGKIKDGGDYTTSSYVYTIFHFCKYHVPVNGRYRVLQTGSCFEISLESCTPTTPSKTAAVFTQIVQEIMTCGMNLPPVANSAVSARKLTLKETFFVFVAYMCQVRGVPLVSLSYLFIIINTNASFFNIVPMPFNHFVHSAAQASAHVIGKKSTGCKAIYAPPPLTPVTSKTTTY